MRYGMMLAAAVALGICGVPRVLRAQDGGAAPGSPQTAGRTDAGVDVGEAGQDGPTPSPSKPGARAEARKLFEQGVQYAAQQRWGEALEYFRRSRALVERPTTLFNIGVALLRLGRPTEALRVLDDYLHGGGPTGNEARREEARRMLEVALGQIARLKLVLDPRTAEVHVDGEPVAGRGAERELRLDPGEHQIAVVAPGHRTETIELSLLSGERMQRSVALEPLPREVEPATLRVTSNVPDARILVDGEPVGRGTWTGALAPGRHRVNVQASGYDELERSIDAPEGGSLDLHAALRPLEDDSLLSNPVFWVVTAATVAAVGIGVGLGLGLGGGSNDPYPGTTGVVLQGLRAR